MPTEKRREYTKEYQQQPEYKEKHAEAMRSYNATPQAKAKQAAYRATPEAKAKRNERQRSYRNDPEHKVKYKARRAVSHAISTGKLVRLPCHCGETKVEAHHKDYSKPLEVEWLCNKHHTETRLRDN